MTGVMSTPPKGGTNLRKGIKNGSVGQATIIKGNCFKFTWEYQVKTIRKINSKVIKAKMGPSVQVVIVVAFIMYLALFSLF